jgi:hypothetical protein
MQSDIANVPLPIAPESGIYDVFSGDTLVSRDVRVSFAIDRASGEIHGNGVLIGGYTLRCAGDGEEISVYVRSSRFDGRGGALSFFTRSA